MNFDKTKAMRNAEKYLSQGKIRSAIGEYELVVMYDSRDFGTLNTLGDLYTKTTDIKNAVKCYTSVADHYGKQGFAQKAIAVYNKITKLEPNSIDISLKLAELYKVKGSLNEARAHYETLAEHFQKRGQKIEALAMWKEIALLDPTNTVVYLRLADSYFAEKQLEEALDAYIEAGTRFANKDDHENALAPFAKALDIKSDDSKALTAFTKSKFALGRANEAAEKLSELLVEFPHNREIRFLLIDSLIEANEIAEAEKAVVKLVEIEPANYPKFLDLAHIYMATDDVDSATRILSMSSEHMLVGGQADDFHLLVKEILAKKPDQLDALRLLARFCSWQRDEEMLCQSLIKLAQVAKDADSVDDERFALMQLTMIVPHELAYSERLHEINEIHGFEQTDEQENLFDERFLKNQPTSPDTKENSTDSETAADVATDSKTGVAFTGSVTEVEGSAPVAEAKEEPVVEAGGTLKLQKEIDSVRFYIENGYNELAEKAITELRTMFGDRPELNELDAEVKALVALASPDKSIPVEQSSPEHSAAEANSFDLNDFRNELGLEEIDPNDDSDYETHFSTAVAYQEMGLVEDAIKEFQEAISLVRPNDGSRRFFSCANLLGHCFMQQNMPHLALKWFQRTLETSDLNEDEKQGLWYELAGAYEAEGDTENAGRYFEQIYAENVNFRDVSERVKSIAVNH